MKIKFVLAALLCAFMSSAAFAGAASGKNGFYVGLEVGGSSVNSPGVITPGGTAVFNQPGGGAFVSGTNKNKENDSATNSFVGGGSVGYHILPFLRVEAAIDYRSTQLSGGSVELGGTYTSPPNPTSYYGSNQRLYKTDMSVTTFMANSFYDWHNSSPITPYIGGGVGLAYMSMSSNFPNLSSPNGPYQTDLSSDNSATAFAYQIGAGASYPLSNLVDLTIGYRFLGTTEGSFKAKNMGGAPNAGNMLADFSTHEVTIGLRHNF